MFNYNTQSGRLTLTDDGINKVKALTEGEIKEIKIEFTFKPNDTTLTNIKGQTVFTNAIQVTKTRVLTPKTEYEKAIKSIGGGGITVNSSTPGIGNVSFLTETATTSDSSITIKATGDGDVGTIKVKTFINAFNGDSKNRKFDNFSSVIIIGEGSVEGTIASFTVQFTLKDKSLELDVGDGTFILQADITRNYQAHKDTVKWEI